LQGVAGCSRVLQCVVACCSALQCESYSGPGFALYSPVAVRCRVLQGVAGWCSVLQRVAVRCSES